MLRPRLSPHSAAIVCAVAGVLVLLGVAVLLGATRRIARRFAFLDPGHQVADAVAVLLRRAGLPILATAFFLAWTIVYLAAWAIHPADAFRGLDAAPRFADFFYYAVSTAFISPPGDILAHSRGVRAATLIEMLTGFGLLSVYLSTFLDLRDGEGGGGLPGAVGGPPGRCGEPPSGGAHAPPGAAAQPHGEAREGPTPGT